MGFLFFEKGCFYIASRLCFSLSPHSFSPYSPLFSSFLPLLTPPSLLPLYHSPLSSLSSPLFFSSLSLTLTIFAIKHQSSNYLVVSNPFVQKLRNWKSFCFFFFLAMFIMFLVKANVFLKHGNMETHTPFIDEKSNAIMFHETPGSFPI